jgi:hypothetical protein
VKIVRYEEILKVLEELNITIGPAGQTMVRGYSFEEYKKLAKQTEQVDYDCDFHDGMCTGRMQGAPGCCHHCRSTFGYWCKEPQALDEATVRTMAEYFNSGTGFLKAGAGCILPRELRSPTCLYIFCSTEKMSGADRELLFKIQYGANWSKS